MPMTMTERLDHARAALTAYFEAKGEPLPEGAWDFEDTDASDLIADLLHLQKRLGLRDTERTLATALMHFEAEEEKNPKVRRRYEPWRSGTLTDKKLEGCFHPCQPRPPARREELHPCIAPFLRLARLHYN